MSSGTLNISGPSGTIDKDDFVIEIEIFPYSDEDATNHNNKTNDSGEHYKVGNITVKQKGISKPLTDMDITNTFLKQLFGTAEMYHEIAGWSGKIFDINKYNATIEKLFKSDKTQIIFKPTPASRKSFPGGKGTNYKSSKRRHRSIRKCRRNKRKTRKHI